MEYIEKQDGLMLNGQLLDESDRLLLKQAIEMGLSMPEEGQKVNLPIISTRNRAVNSWY